MGRSSGGITTTRATARLRRTAATQVVPSSSTTNVVWQVTTLDTASMVDLVSNNDRITVKKAGVYKYGAYVTWRNTASTITLSELFIRKNGTTVLDQKRYFKDATDSHLSMTVTNVDDFEVDDFLEVRVFHNRGGDLDIENDADMHKFYMTFQEP